MENILNGIPIFFFVCIGIMMLRCYVYQKKLLRYLIENHTEKWKELTTVWGIGPGMANSFKGFKFLYGKDYLDDDEVLRLKNKIRNSYSLILFFVFITFISFLFVVESNLRS